MAGPDDTVPPRRAEPLRADPLPEPEGFASGTLGGVDDPDSSELLGRWESEEHLETESPRRNWSPVVALAVLVALVGVVAAALLTVGSGDDDGPGDDRAADGDGEGDSVLAAEPPSLDELTAEVTIPPGPEAGLAVVDKGVSIVEDRFDPARREGTFAVVIENPHPGWIAQGVQVDVQFLDEGGAAVGGDNAFVEVVLPGQRVAVAALFFDAPTVPVTDLAVAVDVARWRETDPIEGGFVVTDVATEEAEFSGVRTRFQLRSDFTDPLEDVGVTVVHRGPFGEIVGGSDTFVDRLEPGAAVPVEVSLLANVPLDRVHATEVYPAAGFGSVPE